MVKKSERTFSSGPTCEKMSCCKVEALISVDERGQMVLPKEMRDKADEVGDMVKGLLGPVMKEVMAGDTTK